MIFHIRLGKLSWCKSPYALRYDLSLAAQQAGVALRCSHLSKSSAERMISFLHECGIDLARVVNEACVHQDTRYHQSGRSEEPPYSDTGEADTQSPPRQAVRNRR